MSCAHKPEPVLARQLSGAIGVVCLAMAAPAQASPLLTPLALAALGSVETQCEGGEMLAQNIPASKSEAILGGQISALDRIRMEQTAAGGGAPDISAVAMAPIQSRSACAALTLVPRAQPPNSVASGSDPFLGSNRVAIRSTPFNARWDRVAKSRLSQRQAEGLLGGALNADSATLQRVNSQVNRSIAHAEDSVAWRARDYWASASETLRRGRGDCEDVAILKYHLLLRAGFAPRDLYLTLARDLARHADHAMLVVHHEGQFLMLDNATEAILPANVSYDYRPTLSFNSESAWLHGSVSRPRSSSLAYLSVSATSKPRVIGLNR